MCVPGRQEVCVCAAGAEGARICGADGLWAACSACPAENQPTGAGGTGAGGSPASGGAAPVASPAIEVSPASLTFSAREKDQAPTPQAVIVTNVGDAPLEFDASSVAPWLTLTGGQATVPPGSSASVEVAVDVARALPGTHVASVDVTAPAAPAAGKVSVRLRLDEYPDAVAPGGPKLNVQGFTLDKTDPEDVRVILTFSKAIDPATLAAGVTLVDQGGDPIAISATYDAQRRQALITPDRPMQSSIEYELRVGGAVKTPAGSSLDQNDYDSGDQPFVRRFDLSAMTLRLKGHVSLEGISDVWWDGDLLAVAGRNSGKTAFVIDASDITEPKIASSVEAGWAQDVKMKDGYLYATNEPGGVHIWDVHDPYDPKYTALIYDSAVQSVHNLYLYEGFAYLVSNTTGRIEIYDVRDPSRPVRVGSIANPNDGAQIHDLVVVDDVLYGGFLDGGLTLADVSDPHAPKVFSHTSYADDFCHNVWPLPGGRFAVTTDEYVGGRLRVWDLADRAQPKIISSWTPDARSVVHNAQVVGNHAFMSHYTQGLQAVDLSDPHDPAPAQFFETWPGDDSRAEMEGAWGVHVSDGRIAVGDTSGGVYLFRYGAD